jgi:hypothetical protein
MSNWTHVAGIMRIDSFRFANNDMDFEKEIGKECLWGTGDWDEWDKHPEDFLPGGSEGTLNMSVWKNPDRDCLAAYTVSIFGDLRNHDSCEKIIDWFKEKCKKFMIRQAVITVHNEWNGTETYTYEEKD